MRPSVQIALALVAVTAPASAARRGAEAVQSSFLYAIDDGAGRRSTGWAALTWEPKNSELFLVANGIVDIFNDNGLATYSFGDDSQVGSPVAVAALENGDLMVVASREMATELIRCNFRGEPLARVQLHRLAKEFGEFSPNAIGVAGGKVYLADKNAMKVAIAEPDGAVVKTFELAKLIGLGPKDPAEAMMRGFNVDRDGNMLFTVASVFSAYVMSPEGKVRAFGQKGSTPGKFNIVSGIAADEEGRLFLTDSLRAVVMVFDPSFQFLGEFGYRGPDPENLVSPFNLAVGNGRVYVTQSRGAVKAFAVRFD
jgi:hypothetical protein